MYVCMYVLDMTYSVFSGTLNPTQSINPVSISLLGSLQQQCGVAKAKFHYAS